jgi:hypothetical protein
MRFKKDGYTFKASQIRRGLSYAAIFDTTNPVYDPAEEEFRRQMQKKKKKRGSRL